MTIRSTTLAGVVLTAITEHTKPPVARRLGITVDAAVYQRSPDGTRGARLLEVVICAGRRRVELTAVRPAAGVTWNPAALRTNLETVIAEMGKTFRDGLMTHDEAAAWFTGSAPRKADAGPRCRYCGCTDDRGCSPIDDMSCWWTWPDACSRCCPRDAACPSEFRDSTGYYPRITCRRRIGHTGPHEAITGLTSSDSIICWPNGSSAVDQEAAVSNQ